MRHNVVRRLAAGALSATLALGSLPAAAVAEQLGAGAALKAQDAAGSWRQDGDSWSFVTEGGGLATGWRRIDGSWFLFDAAGAMLTGWQRVGDTWYFLSATTGRMYASRWYWDGASWYWLGADGAMATGWAKVWADWYLMDASGRMLTGWQRVGQDWYYLHASGAMAHSEDVGGYWLREDGAWDDSARPADADGPRARLAVEEPVDPAAASALLRVESDVPFAEQLGASTLRATADWEGATVESATRTSPTSAEVLVSGLPGAAGASGLGGVAFDEGSFADASATGVAAMSTQHAEPALVDVDYSEADGLFRFTLSLGSAQLVAADDASAFSFPGNPNIRVAEASNQPYGRQATVALEVPGATPYDQLVALAEAFAGGGVEVRGTNAGTVVVREDATSPEEDLDGDTEPAITAFVERGDGGKGYRMNEDGSASIDLSVRVASTGAGLDLSRSTFRFDDELLEVVAQRVPEGQGDRVELTMFALTPEDLDELREIAFAMEVSDEELLDIVVYVTAARMAESMSVAGGIVNEHGIELPADQFVEATAYCLAGLGDTIELEEGAFADEGAEVAVQDDGSIDSKTSANDASQSSGTSTTNTSIPRGNNSSSHGTGLDEIRAALGGFCKNAGSIITTIGKFATAFAKGSPSAFIGGVSSIFGLIAEWLGAGVSSSWSLNDVMNRVIALDSKIDTVTAQLGDITHQLDRLEASVDYKTQVGNITSLAQQAMRYRPWVMRALDKAADAPDRLTYKMGDDLATSATGQALQDLYTNTTGQSSVTGGGKRTAQVALDLANAIIGNPQTHQTGGVKSFFDYTASCVNWEPETYSARLAFTSYVSGAFVYAYIAASNELNHQIYYARDEAQKVVYQQTLAELMEAAEQVDKLIGENGSLMPATTDRADGRVLCTVNGKLYQKSADGLGAIYAPLRNASQPEFESTFHDLLNERDEDYVRGYANRSAMSRSDFETMAKRQAYVRTLPGYEGATSIRKEMELVGLLPAGFSYPDVTKSAEPYSYNGVVWKDPESLGRALVGDATQSDKRDASSSFHKRWYSAEMYDVDNNRALGSQELYYINVDYMFIPARWKVYLTIQPVFEMVTK